MAGTEVGLPEGSISTDALISDLWPPELGKNLCLLFFVLLLMSAILSHTVCGHLLSDTNPAAQQL